MISITPTSAIHTADDEQRPVGGLVAEALVIDPGAHQDAHPPIADPLPNICSPDASNNC